jgi:hypothetical protein
LTGSPALDTLVGVGVNISARLHQLFVETRPILQRSAASRRAPDGKTDQLRGAAIRSTPVLSGTARHSIRAPARWVGDAALKRALSPSLDGCTPSARHPAGHSATDVPFWRDHGVDGVGIHSGIE